MNGSAPAVDAAQGVMDLDDQMRRYFGTSDMEAIPPPALAAGIERMQVDLGMERDPARRFALWALLYTLGGAPDPAAVFPDRATQDAARSLMALSERMTADESKTD